MKRTIRMIVTYNLDDPELEGMQITPKEYAEEKTYEELMSIFCEDEGFESMEIEVVDE